MTESTLDGIADTFPVASLGPQPEPPDPYLGRLLADRYRVERKLAAGATSTIYSATHTTLGRRVAIKIMQAAMAQRGAADLLLREARTVGGLGHPYIVEALDAGATPEGKPFLVLELLDGVDLSTELERCRRMPLLRALRIARQIASALQAAHEAGIIHRDLKPQNVFLLRRDDGTDHVKVLDFGIAKQSQKSAATSTLTAYGGPIGTPAYMAPEQILTPEIVDHRIDIHALGAILFECLAGVPLWEGREVPELFARISCGPSRKLGDVVPDINAEVAAIVDTATETFAEARFQSMEEFGMVLESAGIVMAATTSRRVPTPSGPFRPLSLASEREPTGLRRLPPRAAAQWVLDGPASERETRSDRWQLSLPSRLVLVAAGLVTAFAVGLAWQGQRPQAHYVAGEMASPATVALEIRSQSHDAQAVVRGHSFPTPFTARFKPGFEPEMVEVTSPGHKERRFWITLDRDINLSVELTAIAEK